MTLNRIILGVVAALTLTLSGCSNLECSGNSCVCESGDCEQQCSGGSCQFSCSGETCKLDCPGGNCQLACAGATSCELTGCTSNCSVSCGGAATCSSSCKNMASGCTTAP